MSKAMDNIPKPIEVRKLIEENRREAGLLRKLMKLSREIHGEAESEEKDVSMETRCD